MSMVPQSQYEQLMGDFTTINLQLNETRNKLYDSQQQAAALQATLKTTQAEFTKSSKQLRRARRTIDRSKDKKALEQALEENSDLQEQLAAMKRVVRKMQEENAAKKDEDEEKRRASWAEFVEKQKQESAAASGAGAGPTTAAGAEVDGREVAVGSNANSPINGTVGSDEIPPLPPRGRTVSGPGLFDGDSAPKAPEGLFDGSDDDDDEDKEDKEDEPQDITRDNAGKKDESGNHAAKSDNTKTVSSNSANGGDPASADTSGSAQTPKSAGGAPPSPAPRISRRPSAVMEAMAKAQQDELIKLRSALEKETLRAKEQNESFQGDLSRMLTRVAEKESELQSAKAEAAAAVKESDKHAAAASAAAAKISTLESRLATLEASNKESGKTAEALAAAHARVSVLETTGRALKAEKERCEAALKGFSSANADAVAKMNKEKEQALAELRSDTKLELALLNDKVKAMERERESAQSKETAAEESRIAQAAQFETLKTEMDTMTAAHAKLENDAADAAKELADVKSALIARDTEMEALTAVHTDLARKSEAASVELATEQSKLKDSLAQLAACNERIFKTEAKLEEAKVEHKIASRRQKDLIKDLKKSLMKETKRQESMAKKSAAKKKEMAGLRERIEDLEMEIAVAKQAQHREEVEAPMIPARSPAVGGGGSSGGGSGSSGGASRSPGGGLSGLMKKVQSKIELKTGGGVGGGSAGGGGGGATAPDVDGVRSALAAKLEQLLKENVYVKEKVVMLESIIQDLTNELEAKKTALASTQSTPTSGDAGNPFAASASRTPPRRQRMSTEADAVDEI